MTNTKPSSLNIKNKVGLLPPRYSLTKPCNEMASRKQTEISVKLPLSRNDYKHENNIDSAKNPHLGLTHA